MGKLVNVEDVIGKKVVSIKPRADNEKIIDINLDDGHHISVDGRYVVLWKDPIETVLLFVSEKEA